MAYKTLLASQDVARYLNEEMTAETPVQKALRAETAKMPNAGMQISPDQGAALALLARTVGARRVLEVGTFTGYSALTLAAALPADGRLVACDVSETWTGIGRRHWQQAGLADRIELRIGPAVETLATLLDEGQAGSFDLAFIDADKENYDAYYEAALKLVRAGGLILLDNAIYGGKVADASVTSGAAAAIRQVNQKVMGDNRVHAALLSVGDGILTALKK